VVEKGEGSMELEGRNGQDASTFSESEGSSHSLVSCGVSVADLCAMLGFRVTCVIFAALSVTSSEMQPIDRLACSHCLGAHSRNSNLFEVL
jgi:hypothetical protein